MAVNRGRGRRIGTIVKITGVLIVALVVGAVAILYSFDVNEYRGFVAERVEAASGRALEIEGDVELKLSLHPRLGIAGVSFANAPWGSHPVMMRFERLEAEVSLVPLLFGEVHVDRLVLVGADILLETDKNGRANWHLAAPAEAPPPSADGAPRIPSFSEILIEDLRVRFRDGATGQTLSLGLDRLEAEAASLSSPVVLAAKGTYGSQPFQAEARLGSLDRLLGKGTGPYRVRLALFAGGAEERIEGALAEPLKARGVDLVIEAKGNELAELAA